MDLRVLQVTWKSYAKTSIPGAWKIQREWVEINKEELWHWSKEQDKLNIWTYSGEQNGLGTTWRWDGQVNLLGKKGNANHQSLELLGTWIMKIWQFPTSNKVFICSFPFWPLITLYGSCWKFQLSFGEQPWVMSVTGEMGMEWPPFI